MSQRTRSVSPQLRALAPEWRVFAVFLDVIAAGCTTDQACIHPNVQTAILAESGEGEGWNQSHAERTLAGHGWRNADGIYDAAGIPEKHRRVVDLALWRHGEPTKQRKGYFSLQEIADMTGHPLRTVKLWLHDDMPKLKRLDWNEVA